MNNFKKDSGYGAFKQTTAAGEFPAKKGNESVDISHENFSREKAESPAKRQWKTVRLLLIFAAIAIIAGMYKTVEIQKRAVILGLGVDFSGGVYEITAEAISPSASNTGGSVGGSGSTTLLTGSGVTAATALRDIYRTTGRVPSLGQTIILVLGEGVFDTDVRDTLSFFQASDVFRDGAIVATCKGPAKELFQSVTPIDNIVASALRKIIAGAAGSTGTPSNSILKFLESQTHGAYASYVCRVEFDEQNAKEEEGGSGGGQKKEGAFDCSKLDVFKHGRHTATVGYEDVAGYILLNEKSGHSVFVTEGVETNTGTTGKLVTEIISKKVKSGFSLTDGVPSVVFQIDAKIMQAYVDSSGYVLDFLPVYGKDIPEAVQEDVERQILESVKRGVLKSVELDCDYFGFYRQFYAELGKKWKEFAQSNPDYLQKIRFEFAVEVRQS